MLFRFLTIVTRWSRSRFTSNFYAMIGTNLKFQSRMALFLFLPCWMRKRIIKAQAILALFDSLQELHLEIW